jgi:hypothetical protein
MVGVTMNTTGAVPKLKPPLAFLAPAFLPTSSATAGVCVDAGFVGAVS